MKTIANMIKFYLAIFLLNPVTIAGLISSDHRFTAFGAVIAFMSISVLFIGAGKKFFNN